MFIAGDQLMAHRPEAQVFLKHLAPLATPAEFVPGKATHTSRLFCEVCRQATSMFATRPTIQLVSIFAQLGDVVI